MSNNFRPELHIFQSPKFRGIVDDAVSFFNATSVQILPPPESFVGAGVYALYYLGSFKHYQRLSAANQEVCTAPIYVGKAVPPGWRTARVKRSDSPALYGRLREHHRSIEQVENLDTGSFRCRFMILRDIESDLVVPVEAELIRLYRPLWNTTLDGFGNHDPGSGRYNQAPSEWDTLHPGRIWASRLRGTPPDLSRIIGKVEEHLANQFS
jgi:hypothetical protein